MIVISSPATAQQKNAQISELKAQIAALELIDNDPSTSSELRAVNKRFLNERRISLRNLILERLNLLRTYEASTGSSLRPDEKQVVENSIAEFEKSLAAVEETLEDRSIQSREAASPPSPGPAVASPTYDSQTHRVVNRDPISNPSTLRSIDSVPEMVDVNESLAPSRLLPQIAFNPATDCQAENVYSTAPTVLRGRARQIAAQILVDIGAGSVGPARFQAVSGRMEQLLLFTVADAIKPDNAVVQDPDTVGVGDLEQFQYLVETARTDKQVGASARSEGSTSAIEKPGFANLLGFAIENGAIQQAVDGTILTLSTSPYVFYTRRGGDTVQAYQDAGFLNRVGVAASFKISEQDPLLANARRNQLTEWSIRYRFLGDRSTRTKAFQKFWDEHIAVAVRSTIVSITQADVFIANDPVLRPLRNETRAQLITQLGALYDSDGFAAKSDDAKIDGLVKLILCYLRVAVYNRVANGAIQLTPVTQSKITNDFIQDIAKAQRQLDAVREVLNDRIESVLGGPLATLGYYNQRQAVGSDYSVAKILFEQDKGYLRPLKLTANFATSFYHSPDRTQNQKTLRDISGALSFERSIASPFTEADDLSRITFAFTGHYQRMYENQNIAGKTADIGVGQFKVEIPLYKGVSFPFSVSYATATELLKEKHVRANFGFTFDIDELVELTRSRFAK
jgi:hypothetical protein